ncbi:TetR family transcriptional regulator [Microbacterium protaetiae]|uniref:TetR family transcriptional regulator n=1 Tax=Microbacterium protaetiae TaxID=2509458 RepID=A0A4P6EEB8_9MICO|nr:TetR family transcriptional regulator [Microbacterium protaetiae]QAY60645.1 TetR family transcriptional regulator [Microbacterium protaetiae]
MPEHTGVERPGGRTARTRRAVHAAVRELLAEPDVELSIPAVAARSGVHATTVYRRWRTIESLLLDVAVDDLNAQHPVTVTGDLEVDLTGYVHRLLVGIRSAGQLAFFQAIQSASRQADSAAEIEALVGPRVAQFQELLDAAGVTVIGGMRLVELIIAPAYFWAQVGAPLDPDRDTRRLVETVLRVAG